MHFLKVGIVGWRIAILIKSENMNCNGENLQFSFLLKMYYPASYFSKHRRESQAIIINIVQCANSIKASFWSLPVFLILLKEFSEDVNMMG